MELIELHILQSFPVTCLNRDDVGAPKSAFFGGVQRARVSSQSWKRAIRSMARELQPGLFAGTRTRYVILDLRKRFAEAGRTDQESAALAEITADALGTLDSVEKGNVKTLLYFSPQEMQNVARKVLEADFAASLANYLDAKTSTKAKEKAKVDIARIATKASEALKSKVKDAGDIAIFGRMVADDASLTLEGSALFSHALSTHRAVSEVEFFSAVDDAKPEENEDAGAGHIGTLEFNSACYYRYVGLNLDLLKNGDHLGHFSAAELDAVVTAFVKSSLLAVPGARKNSMFGFNPPSFVLGLRRRGHPLSLVNAFEAPIKPTGDGYIEPSKAALLGHWERLRTTYGVRSDIKEEMPPQNFDMFIEALAGTATRAA